MEQVHLKFCFSNKKKLKQTLVSSIFFLLSSVGEGSHLPTSLGLLCGFYVLLMANSRHHSHLISHHLKRLGVLVTI